MPIGNSGRIVVEIDPAKKQEIYAELQQRGLTLREWFLAQADHLLRERQPFLPFDDLPQELDRRNRET